MKPMLYAEVAEVGAEFKATFGQSYGICVYEVSTLGECDPDIAPQYRLRYCLRVSLRESPADNCQLPEEYRDVRMFYQQIASVHQLHPWLP